MKPLLAAIRWPFSLLATILLQPDKVGHLYWGMAMGLAALAMGWWALSIVIIGAALKEIYDLFHPPAKCELWDFIATLIGGCASIALITYRLGHV